MKKLSVYALLGCLGLSMAACDEDFKDWAEPQSSEQEKTIVVEGFKASEVEPVDLAKEEGESVRIFALPENIVLPEGMTVENVRATLTEAKEEGDVTDAAKSVVVMSDVKGMVSKEELSDFVVKTFGKRPVKRTISVKVCADVMKEGQAVFVDAGNVTLQVTPKAPIIKESYYLIGNMCDWKPEQALKFNHSDMDVYEDPVFTLMFSVDKPDCYWKIIPVTDSLDGALGTEENGDESTEGVLVAENPNAGKIKDAGIYLMTLNMMDYTYKLEQIAPEYYIVGAMQGWNSKKEGMTCLLYPSSAMKMSYTTKFEGDGNLKIWLGSNFGDWNKALGAEEDGTTAMSGNLLGSGAVKVPETDAYYTFEADMATMSYRWIKLENQNPETFEHIALIGAFNGWNGDMEMKEVTPHNWYILFEQEKDGELKVRANHGWTVSWGTKGKVDVNAQYYFETTTDNGDNISLNRGTYRIYFNDVTGKMAIVKND